MHIHNAGGYDAEVGAVADSGPWLPADEGRMCSSSPPLCRLGVGRAGICSKGGAPEGITADPGSGTAWWYVGGTKVVGGDAERELPARECVPSDFR